MTNPIIDQQRGFRVWGRSEIYTGPSGSGEYVPNPNDAVIDWTLGLMRVTDVDYSTGLSTLAQASFTAPANGVVDADVMLGSGPGTISESYRLYVNTDVVPHTAAVDSRLHIYSQSANHVKFFRGTDISETGHVISAVFNASGIMTSENIPLELITTADSNNLAIKAVAVANVIETVADGSDVTMVVYNAGGQVVSISRLLVVNTNFVRTTDASKRYISSISLESQFLSSTDNTKIQYPINMLVQTDAMKCRVLYSDGNTDLIPIDGTKVKLIGIDNYIASVEGQTEPMILTYYLADDEFAMGVSAPLPDRFISQLYHLETIAAQGAYSVKLFVVPRWVSTPTTKWTLDYYLYDMTRDNVVNVTPYVEYATNSAVYNGTAIGGRQELTVAINLSQLGVSYMNYRHVQAFAITNKALGGNNLATDYHDIEYTDNVHVGVGVKATATASATSGQWKISVGNGYTLLADWLAAVYTPCEPLYYTASESSAPSPTHFRARIGTTWSREIQVDNYQNLIDNITVEPVQGQPLRLEFFRRNGTTDLELGVVALTIQRP